MVMDKIYDKVGQEITAGSYIVYGHALGRCAALQLGKVLEVVVKPSEYRHYLHNGVEYRIKVRGAANYPDKQTCTPLSRAGVLQFPDRIIVLREDQVPDYVKAVLDA
ncbi:MAG TPA: hypothetical protein VK253_00905 [Candidatus Binatia bacterium]|nr:hypothetical protein [Candidatus Binatia bacterium]